MEAGVLELDSDANVREVCRLVREYAADPLMEYGNLPDGVDLMDLFDFTAARGYDFLYAFSHLQKHVFCDLYAFKLILGASPQTRLRGIEGGFRGVPAKTALNNPLEGTQIT